MTELGRGGVRSAPVTGVEVCRPGPGGNWLLTEMSITWGGEEVATFTLIGLDPRAGQYTGTLVDSFGGELGLLKGTPDPELETRTLRMYSARSTPGFDARWIMRWQGPDQRTTRIEVLRGEEWVPLREIVHTRRP